ncbi:MAG TPA: hypothetical protein VFR86_22835 [Burkholderiaceae bacterium]|nr:hypothetical protein [Burkholderiaceae bacterium]
MHSHAEHRAEATQAGHDAARECAAIAADLERLKVLIAEAGEKLTASFAKVGDLAPHLGRTEAERRELGAAVAVAITALQFQDMATQLTAHAQRRLTVLETCLKTLAAGEADPLLATTRMQPVRQAGMNAGAIDLF